jgi:putative CocE/NonD family hydrolase
MRAAVLALGLFLIAGCLGASPPPPGGAGAKVPIVKGANGSVGGSYPHGVHPYPMGDEWPAGLEGPFERASLTNTVIEANGVHLDGWIYRPKVPEGVRVPVLLWSTPYFGQTMPPANDERVAQSTMVPVNVLVARGYAVALFSVRGTGNSEGCFEFFGPNEQKDQASMVNWLAGQPWSNGRVGMMGLSYHGTTPWEAAIQNPPGLKTIVVAGMVGDLYTFMHTPQGAMFTVGAGFAGLVTGLVSLAPASNFASAPGNARGAPTIPGRVCPDVANMLQTMAVGTFTDSRDAKFWNERNLIQHFPEVQSSVFLTHGFQDNVGSGHQQQEDYVWGTLAKAPKRQLEGQWQHEFPNSNAFKSDWALHDWFDRLFPWLDFWLKGIGPAPPGIETVDYQDGAGTWHQSGAWPPREKHDEVLYFNQGKMDAAPATAAASFRAAPNPRGVGAYLCPSAAPPAEATGLIFTTSPSAQPVIIAGNPIAYLPITSDLPGGLVAVHVYLLGKNFACAQNGATGARLLVAGVANLRFHAGGYQGKDFPVNARTPVRIDITNLAEVVAPGDRLAFVLSYGEPSDRTGAPYVPKITLMPGSAGDAPHVVLPVLEGTLGGAAPTLAYAARPFVPVVALL